MPVVKHKKHRWTAGGPVSGAVTKRVAAFLKRHRLDRGSAPLIIAVSGGPDSVCLLHALAALRPRSEAPLHAVHVNHQLRGGESEADARYVEERCRGLVVPLEVSVADARAYQKSRRLSLEEAARHVRHRALAEVARRLGARAVLLAHTADDQAETVLMHLLRGTGVGGLGGMEEVGRGIGGVILARPLLTTARAETEAYCREQSLEPRLDPSNLSLAFTRNRVRHELLPALEEFNPSARQALTRLAGSAAEVTGFLDAEVNRQWAGIVESEEEGLALDRAKLLALHPALQAHFLRRAVGEARGSLQGVTAQHILDLRSLAAGPTGKRLKLPGGPECVTEYGRLLLIRLGASDKEKVPQAEAVRLRVPGVTILDDWQVAASLGPPREGAGAGKLAAEVNADLAERPLWVRYRRPGDRFQPLGGAGTKKLQDFFVDAKVPQRMRGRTPLLCSDDAIMWVVGYRLSEAARVRPGSEVLRIDFSRAS